MVDCGVVNDSKRGKETNEGECSTDGGGDGGGDGRDDGGGGGHAVPEPYRGEYWRCDLHGRFRPDGGQFGFNSVHEGSRQLYVMDVALASGENRIVVTSGVRKDACR